MQALFRVVNRGGSARGNSDEGVTLVEVIVAMAIVVTGLLALLGEFTTYLHQQRSQRAHAFALRFATTTLEDARRQGPGKLAGLPPSWSQTHDGVQYTATTNVQACSGGIAASSCQRVGVTVAWSDASGAHHVDLGTADADTSATQVAGCSNCWTNNTTGATGTSVALTSFSVSPTTVSVDASNHPTTDVTLNLTVTGLANTTSVSATWTDDTGTHHATLTNNGGTLWSAVIPKAQITRAVSGSSPSVTFAATVPGLSNLPTATLRVVPSLSNCQVIATPIVLVPLTRRTSLAEVLSCNASGLTGTDTVTATYATGTTNATVSMTTSNGGSSWSYTLPANTTMVSSGSSETFTFRLTRTSDNYTASTNLTAALA